MVSASPRIVLAQSQLELAQKQLEVTASWLQTSLSSGYTQNWSSLEVSGETTTDNEGDIDPISLNAALNVVPYGPWHERVQQSRWAVERARLALRDERANVIIELTAQFQSSLRAEENVALEAQKLELAELNLAAAQTRLEAGAATPSDLLQLELALQQAQEDALSAERERAQALAQLSNLLGQAVSDVSGTLPDFSDDLTFDDENVSTRSDVVTAQLGVAEAEQNANAIRRENLPSGSVSAGYSVGGEDATLQLGAGYSLNGANAYQPSVNLSYDPDTGLRDLPAGTSQSFSVGIDVVIPFDIALPDALEAARLSVEGARLRAEQALTLARLEAETLAANLSGARATGDLAEQILDQRRNSLDITQQRFDLGLISMLELAEAKVNVLEAELSLHRAEDAVRLAAMRYAAALALNPLEVLQ